MLCNRLHLYDNESAYILQELFSDFLIFFNSLLNIAFLAFQRHKLLIRQGFNELTLTLKLIVF